MTTSIIKYRSELERSCARTESGRPEIIKEISNIFKTLESLIKEKDLTNKQRIKLFAAIGYFFIPDDLFPEEELGDIGYIDDIILALTILKDIYDSPNGKEIIGRNWKLHGSMEITFSQELLSLARRYPKQFMTVLDYFGLLPDELDLDLDFE